MIDNERRMNTEQSDTTANAAINNGPCFKCEGPHMSRHCSEPDPTCFKCGQNGHIAEFCDRLKQ